jgi:peroxiredoxin
MKRMLFAIVAGWMAVMMIAEAQDTEVQRARDTLASSAAAYRAVVALRDKLSYSVTAPGSEQETKSEEYTFGPEGAVIVKNALLQAVALDSKLYLTQSDVSDKYVVAPYDGDFGAALRRVAGNGSLFEPPPLALHSGKSIDACLDTLRFNLLEPLRLAGCRHPTGDREQDEIRFVANNGELTLAIDSKTHFFIGVSFQVRPPGAPEGFLVRVSGTFSPQVLSGPELAIDFTPGSRGAVENLADLTSTRLAVGSTAPDFELESLDGKEIALHDLRGSVVVLDFWATWCVPCWTALKETQALASWAAADHLPVTIFAVNTLEQSPDSKERLDRVRCFWKSQGFSIPTLVDVQSKMFKAYGSPGLPGAVLISPSGTILRYHEGLLPEMLETLKRETREQISSQKRSQM